MKNSRLAILIGAAVLLGSLLYYLYGGSASPAGQRELMRLTAENFPEFQTQFNAAQDRVRVIAMLSPT
jgi:hypothetical protein